ncbi:MAG: type II toxin-antitoxin system VapC family toxin [Synergistaceae bacterium]|nr:type II toxin-antitoxin system VapC family toxin [Synergistaceae bacterium]
MTAVYMLDTDTCSYIIKRNPASIVQAFWEHKKDEICISSVTYAELTYGAMRKGSTKNPAAIRRFVAYVGIVDFDDAAAEEYARIRCFLEAKGIPVAAAELMIASCAKIRKAILVTNNVKHFSRVPDLVVENWIEI